MSRVNWGRWALGGLVASVIAFFTDGFLHEVLIHEQWEELLARLQLAPAEQEHVSSDLFYFALFDLGRGFVTMFLYVMMRARLGPGPKTAAWAGVAAWAAFSLTCPAQFIPLGFFSVELWWRAGAFQLVTSILAALAGAWLYRE
ncbi:MAG TPA: hypothetical protein VJV23_00245 [Candidatus Polarisedimenticolia bacterium]|nr:hypothetical protein [Candidatus Polarisedimenticolia bacterium]